MASRPDDAPHDVEELSDAVAKAYFPHEITRSGSPNESASGSTLRTLDLGPVLIGHVGWGVDVRVECDYQNAYEINIPLAGHLESRGRHGTVTSTPGQATVFRADTPTLISHWDATCTVLGVKFDSTWLDREAERILDDDIARVGGVLPDQLELNDGAGHDWRRLVGSLAADLCEPDMFSSMPVVRDQLAEALAPASCSPAAPTQAPPHRPDLARSPTSSTPFTRIPPVSGRSDKWPYSAA